MAEASVRERNQSLVFELYRNGVPKRKICELVGIDKKTIAGIISRGFAEGDIKEFVVDDDEKKLILLYEQGKTYTEMANALEMSSGTVCSTLGRLRREGLLGYRR